jgi:hypothetical protein
VSPRVQAGHAFISYVREDSGEVEVLQRMLEAAGVPVWRDTANLWPGEDWRAKIRDAITQDALVFIACFSKQSAARKKNYQYEELLLAIDQFRLRRPDDVWLIPVRFDNCIVPDLGLGAGRTLASIQRVDLFGRNRDMAMGRLVAAVQRLLRPPISTIAEPSDAVSSTGGVAGPQAVGSDPPELHRSPGDSPKPTLSHSLASTIRASESGAAGKKPRGTDIICPTCFSPLDWVGVPLWRWDDSRHEYVQIEIAETANREERARMTRGAVVGCSDPEQVYGDMHFIPYEYGLHGKPIMLAFIGDTGSGKSSLLAALMSEIDGGGLDPFNVSIRAMDLALHRRSLNLYDEMHRWRRVLPPAWRTGATFADAFVVTSPRGARSVVFLDVTEVSRELVNNMAHLTESDGFIFVADSTRLWSELSDSSFSGRVLNLLQMSDILPRANVSVALTMGDMLPPEHPFTRWLAMPIAGLDAQMISQERDEILAFLESVGASGWWNKLRRECCKLTLHVVSAYGSIGDPLKASGPQRMLEPFVAMLAMTGVLSGEDARRIGA